MSNDLQDIAEGKKPTFGIYPDALEGQTAVEINLSGEINGHFLLCGAASQHHRTPGPSITTEPDSESQDNVQQRRDRDTRR